MTKFHASTRRPSLWPERGHDAVLQEAQTREEEEEEAADQCSILRVGRNIAPAARCIPARRTVYGVGEDGSYDSSFVDDESSDSYTLTESEAEASFTDGASSAA